MGHGFVIKDLRNKRSTSNNFLLATIQSFQEVIPAPLDGLDEIGVVSVWPTETVLVRPERTYPTSSSSSVKSLLPDIQWQ